MMSETTQPAQLKRKLGARHLNMIAIGGSIGTGLFLASGATIANAGPGGALLAYCLIGVMIYFLMTSLGELATHNPTSGAFFTYGTKYVEGGFGFALGWNYWYNWAITVAFELVAVQFIMKFWFPDLPGFYWSALFLAVVFGINALTVKGFGESEFFFSLVKVLAIIVFIIIGIFMIAKIMMTPGVATFANWTKGEAPFVGGLSALIGVAMIAGFSFQGTEMVGVAAGESKDPQKTIPIAIKQIFWREARFYAWIAFDGCEYAKKINDGNSLWLNLKNTNTNGWSQSNTRNCAGTGYLSKKFIDPNIRFGANGTRTHRAARRPYIRMAELYLNLAECYAALDNTTESLANLNEIRERAGLKELTDADLTGDMTLMDWVRNERFVELYEEGFRYYDVRRWMIAPTMLKAGVRYGLNGLVENPSFEEFNQPTLIDQPFKWDNRLYLMPIWSRQGMDELYSNPQLVQAPGY
jgi:hypothetical protein